MSVVALKIDGAIGEVILNRPEKLNAITSAMAKEMMSCLDEAERARIRALVVRGEGKSFCAGRDLSEVDLENEDPYLVLRDVFNPLILRIADFPAPSFAAVQGACLGVGLGIALACDVVYVADDARLGSPFGRIGAVLDSGGHGFFVSRLGSHRALELIYTGRMMSGQEAVHIGLVNRCFAASELLDQVRSVAKTVANGPTAAFVESKRIVRRIQEENAGLKTVLELEAHAQRTASKTLDYKEGIRAFLEKRTPRFVGH